MQWCLGSPPPPTTPTCVCLGRPHAPACTRQRPGRRRRRRGQRRRHPAAEGKEVPTATGIVAGLCFTCNSCRWPLGRYTHVWLLHRCMEAAGGWAGAFRIPHGLRGRGATAFCGRLHAFSCHAWMASCIDGPHCQATIQYTCAARRGGEGRVCQQPRLACHAGQSSNECHDQCHG